VSGGGLRVERPKGHIQQSEVNSAGRRGIVSPEMKADSGLPPPFPGKFLVAKDLLKVALVCLPPVSQRQEENVDDTPHKGAISRGSPGAGKPHAGKYGELTPLRQRGGDG
jgi:hypothetical protein